MVGRLKTIVWDAPDIQALADFYVGAAGLVQHYADDEWVTLYSPDGWRFGVQPPPTTCHRNGRTPPTPSRCTSTSRSPTSRRLPSTPRPSVPAGWPTTDSWITLADPAGHPFDFCKADVEGTKVFAVTIDTADAARARPLLLRAFSAWR